jgi:hypothetical protein
MPTTAATLSDMEVIILFSFLCWGFHYAVLEHVQAN